jgi:hypothetical protein
LKCIHSTCLDSESLQYVNFYKCNYGKIILLFSDFLDESSNSFFLLILILTLVLILTLTIWIFFYRLRPHLAEAARHSLEAALEAGGYSSDPPPAYPGKALPILCIEDHLHPPPSYESLLLEQELTGSHPPANLSLPKYLAESLQCPPYMAVVSVHPVLLADDDIVVTQTDQTVATVQVIKEVQDV